MYQHFFELGAYALKPGIKVIAPWREWDLTSRETLMDYCAPYSDGLPSFDIRFESAPTEANPLGVKGAGEAGTISSAAAVMNAVVDALSPYGVTDMDMPKMTGKELCERVESDFENPPDKIFLVTKVLPSNASRSGTIQACEDSLRRLGTDVIDLYLLLLSF